MTESLPDWDMCFSFQKYLKISIAVFLLSVTLLGGCSKGLFNNPTADGTPQLPFKGIKIDFDSTCLKKTSTTIGKFVEGTAQPAAVSAQWQCYGKAIQTFVENVKGAKENEFAPREIAGFFEFFFLKNTKISDELLQQIMYVKQLFVGGSDQVVTGPELLRLIQLTRQLEGFSLELLPFMKVYSLNWRLSPTEDLVSEVNYFEQSNETIQRVTRELTDIFERNGASYRIENFYHLVLSVSSLESEANSSAWPFLEKLKSAIPLVETIKRTLTGGDQKIVAANEWRRFALLSSRGYVQYLRYYYFIRQVSSSSKGEELAYVVKSIEDLFSYLGDMVREKPKGRFTQQELIEILRVLEKIFPEFQISDKMIVEGMKIKRLFFGGSLDDWSPEDFDNAKVKVNSFREIAVKILNFGDYLTLRWGPQNRQRSAAESYAREAEFNLVDFAESLAQLFETEYDLKDLLVFLNELDAHFPSLKSESPKPSLIQSVRKYLPLLVSFKNLILSDETSLVVHNATTNEWPQFLKFTAKVYARLLYFNYFISHQELERGQGLASFGIFIGDLKTLLEELMFPKKNQVITNKEISRLVFSLVQTKLIDINLNYEAVQKIIFVLNSKILIDSQSLDLQTQGQLRSYNGFGKPQLEYAFFRYQGWLKNQQSIDNAFKQTPKISGVWRKNLEPLLPPDFQVFLRSPVPFTLDFEHRLYLSRSEIPMTFDSVSRLNWTMSLVQLLIRSYSKDPRKFSTLFGLTESECDALFSDFRQAFISIGYLEPENKTFVKGRMLEANLFTPHGNGNSFLELPEAVELLNMIVSAFGIQRSVRQTIEAECPVRPGLKLYQNTLPLNCLMDVYRRNFARFLGSQPDFSHFISSLSGSQLSEFLLLLIQGTGYDVSNLSDITYKHVGLLPHISQYIEIILRRFDSNKSDSLDLDEALKALPVFSDEIAKQQSGKKPMPDNRRKSAFTYLLKYGKAPESLKEKLHFLFVWESFPGFWKLDVNRTGLATIFAFLMKKQSASVQFQLAAELARVEQSTTSLTLTRPDWLSLSSPDLESDPSTFRWIESHWPTGLYQFESPSGPEVTKNWRKFLSLE